MTMCPLTAACAPTGRETPVSRKVRDDMFTTKRKMRLRGTVPGKWQRIRLLYSWVAVTKPSRTILPVLFAMGLPLTARAQDTSRVAAMDSLLARLRALESSVEVLQKQLAE